MKNIFDPNANTEIKKQRLQEIILLVVSFVIVPIISMIVITSGSDRAIYTSISRLAWVDNLFPLILFWGLINMGNFIYALVLTVKAGGYTMPWKKFFIIFAAVGALLMTVGVSIPAYYDPSNARLVALRTAHTVISTTGFSLFYVLMVIMAITILKRNKRQGWLSIAIVAFMIAGGAFAIVEANDAASYCTTSAVSQIFFFGLYNTYMAIQYFFMTTFKPELVKTDNAE